MLRFLFVMTNSNPENPADNSEPTAAAPAAPAPAPAPAPNPGLDARRRLRELLSVPERDRTDEQWDEIIELEIQLAPGNRISGNEAPLGGGQSRGQHNQGKSGGGQKKHRPRVGGGGGGAGGQQQRRPRQNKPQGGGGQQG